MFKLLKNIKIFKKSYDGGPKSGVTGYWLIENKDWFSIVLLNFSKGSREAYHSHAFNAYTWWLKGEVAEVFKHTNNTIIWKPSLRNLIFPKYTPKNNVHKIIGIKSSWALSIRGPWDNTWKEYIKNDVHTLTHGRKIINKVSNNASI